MNQIKILGAGISGLIAANTFQNSIVLEASRREDYVGHKALLRFRSTKVADAVGIDFRKVRVHKGLWNNGFVAPSIEQANLYSLKAIGKLADRSVWNLEAVDRYIAPDNFVDELIERCGDRIQWNTRVDRLISDGGQIISTIPMPSLMGALTGSELRARMSESAPVFSYRHISVRRWKIRDADVFQSVYISDPDTTCYRISITGDTMIAEYIGESDQFNVFEPFGANGCIVEELPSVKQRYGKISPIDDRWRKAFMLAASQEHNIFSLGRFATWRNILLDDVVHDIAVIKRLMADDAYGRARFNAK